MSVRGECPNTLPKVMKLLVKLMARSIARSSRSSLTRVCATSEQIKVLPMIVASRSESLLLIFACISRDILLGIEVPTPDVHIRPAITVVTRELEQVVAEVRPPHSNAEQRFASHYPIRRAS